MSNVKEHQKVYRLGGFFADGSDKPKVGDVIHEERDDGDKLYIIRDINDSNGKRTWGKMALDRALWGDDDELWPFHTVTSGRGSDDCKVKVLGNVLDDYSRKINQNKPMSNVTDTLQDLSTTLKRVLNKDMQKQYKSGLIDGDLELTKHGKEVIWSALQEEYSDELTEEAEDIIKENE